MSILAKAARALGFHVHEWQHLQTVVIPSRTDDDGRVVMHHVGRIIYYRECRSCEKWGQYYPRTPRARYDQIV